ncbi:hypothetical protein GCM10011613_26710 [Cellvibrio zantedeschiae]|uniref:DUF1330 domain-containing protein n=1 Tax=Cellvibrio zantedeschiae TaxID=1237077 RepID=A0ABQ3B6B0_9GAMM|nr:DUF1330 domain-containing protein [Cellvibrio zantedeschiae]GGY80340.1 hypothetical protein GCM10011613_26710 [Cellvibrio zantedeschiae]
MYTFLTIVPVSKLACALSISLALISIPSFAHDLKAGERLTFVLSENKPGGEEVAKTYFSKAFPLAQEAGMREITTFKVLKTVLGDGKPEGSGLYLWPNKEAANKTRNNPDYLKNFKPLRPQAWNQLQAVDMEITKPMTINLDKTKTYTAGLIWIKDKAAYERYFEGAKAARERLGSKTILKLPGVRYDKLTEGEITPPDLVVIQEWPTAKDAEAYSQTPEFQSQLANYQQGVSKLELFQLGFWN